MRLPFLSSRARRSTNSRSPAVGPSPLQRRASPVAAAYFPDWASVTPSSLDFSKFDILMFAFATPTSSNGISYDSGATSTLQSLVSAAHGSGYGTKVVLSIGGWTGSTYFSKVMTPANQDAFVQACVDAVSTYDLDGIDIDWEYPNAPGDNHPYSPSDAANLLSFFTALRSALGSSKIISAAVSDLPWYGSNGDPLTDVSAYAKQMTYANIMNYDVFAASATPGPNAPLGNICGNSTRPQYSAEAAVQQWTAAGFPAGQLMLGVPFYGYVSESSKTTLSDGPLEPAAASRGLDAYRRAVLSLGGTSYPVAELRAGDTPEGLVPLDGAHPLTQQPPVQFAPLADGDLSAYWGGEIAFSDLIAQGALQETSSGTFVAVNGYTYAWDDCSDTPFLYDTARTTVVTFDDTGSIGDKAAYAKNEGLAGAFAWSLNQDYNYVLQDAIRSGLGL